MDAALAELIEMASARHRSAAWANSEDVGERLAWRRLTAETGDRLARILDQHGWPGERLVGEEAARCAWLVAQHADRQLDVQRRPLTLMAQAVESGEASARDLAFLRDRVLVPERLDERRSAVGIEPFAIYTRRHAPPVP